MAKTPAKTKKAKQKASPTPKPANARQLKQPKYASFKLSKTVIKGEKLPSAFRLFRDAGGVLFRNWKIFLFVLVIYGLVNALLVQGFRASGDVATAKDSFSHLFGGSLAQFTNGLTLFAFMLGSSGNTTNATAGVYQFIMVILTSLALIWILRQLFAGNQVRMRDGFYRGMTPLVPFLLVLIVIGLELIPMAVGLMLYGFIVSNGIAASMLEQILWAMVAFIGIVITLYMLTSSLFALYIVTLPDMTPMKALRTARQVVANRRWMVLRKILFLPLALCVLAGLVIIPIIVFATPLAVWAFFLLTMLLWPVLHSYMYVLYRAMI